jgi:hypothetical protein
MKMIGRLKRPSPAAVALALFIGLMCLMPAAAALDANTSVPAADALTVTVGYFGGPYYEKHVFTLDELWGMDVVRADYTMIDNMPSVVIDHVAGVTLAGIMDAAGIDIGSVETFNFWTNDKLGGYYNSLSKASLIDTPRYCFYSLPDNFDYDLGRGSEYATVDGVRVPTVIALADDWRRVLAGASFGSDYTNLNESTRFRLVYGQTDAVTRTASESAKWIHRIEVTLGGAPTLTADSAALELEVGSKFRSQARVAAADPVIAENAEITWESGDESIVSVDENGEITALSEGNTVVIASYAGQTVEISVSAGLSGGADDSGDIGNGTDSVSDGTPGISGEQEVLASGDGSDADVNSNTDAANRAAPDRVSVSEGEQEREQEQERERNPEPGARGQARSVVVGIPLTAVSRGDEGGVQNWRSDEMADTAVEMPEIIPEQSALFPSLCVVSVLCGGAYEFIKSRREM